jgi:hypothetical protein
MHSPRRDGEHERAIFCILPTPLFHVEGELRVGRDPNVDVHAIGLGLDDRRPNLCGPVSAASNLDDAGVISRIGLVRRVACPHETDTARSATTGRNRGKCIGSIIHFDAVTPCVGSLAFVIRVRSA